MKTEKVTNETQVFFDYLQENVCTATMVSKETGIEQKNITRYKRGLEKMYLLYVIEKKRCPITGFPAQWITTNPFMFPQNNKQLTLF